MKKTFIITTIILLFLLGLSLTNPDKQDFYRYARKNIRKIHEEPESKLKKVITDAAIETKILGLKIATKRKNYGFFSVFKALESDDPYSFRVIGFYKVIFISLK